MAKGTIVGAELVSAVQRMELKPGDVIVVRTREIPRPEWRVYLQKEFARLFPENRVVVLDGEFELFVMGEAPKPADEA